MKDEMIMEITKGIFEMEVANSFIFEKNEMLVILKDGTVARVTAQNLT